MEALIPILAGVIGINIITLIWVLSHQQKISGFINKVSIYGIKVEPREAFGRYAVDYMDDIERRILRLEHKPGPQQKPRPLCVDRPEDI